MEAKKGKSVEADTDKEIIGGDYGNLFFSFLHLKVFKNLMEESYIMSKNKIQSCRSVVFVICF
jgi:hypothetical protein